ncbi:MAG: glycerophosphodiester phosphodiesterase [Thermoplasmata archaeon]
MVFRNYMVIGHRGYTEKYPENTVESFKDAFEKGCDAVEMDVHLTNDGYILVHHDFNIKRMTNVDLYIEESKYSEIKNVKIRGKFKIPLLENVFRLFPDKKLFVELKTVTDDGKLIDNGLEEAVYEMIKRFDRFDNTWVISFNPISLQTMKGITTEISLGLDYDMNSQKYIGEVTPSDLKSMGIDSFLPDVRSFSTEKYRNFRENGIEVYPWPVDSAEVAAIAVKNMASGLITNKCAEILKTEL